MKVFLALLFLITGQLALAQSPAREIALGVDNDYPFMTDQYYTAGIDLYYRFLPKSGIPFFNSTDSSKTILGVHAGLKLFTPKNVDTQDIQYMDRPYCGWNFISAELLHFRKKNSGNSFILQLGVVGRETGLGQLQQWLHKTINLYSIEGWDSQIANELVVNANFNHTHGFPLGKKTELISSSGAWVGTGNNRVTQEFTIRALKFNPLNQSSYMNARISGQNSSTNKSEFFMYATAGVDYVITNIFIQGSLFRNNPSQLTTSVSPWLFTQEIGIQYSSNRISAGLAWIHLSQENTLVGEHNYANASLAYRF